MRTTFISLAALATFTLASADMMFPLDAVKCDTPDAEKVPVDNDCLRLFDDWEGAHSNTGEGKAGEWTRIGCSNTCKIAVKPKEDGAILQSNDVKDGVVSVMDVCFLDVSAGEGKEFKGEVSGGGWTLRVLRGGDC